MPETKPKTLEHYIETAADMISGDAGLRKMQKAMDRMSHLEYTLPEPLSNLAWVRKIISTAPYEALRGSTRALSALADRLKIEPITVAGTDMDADSLAAKMKANEWEKVLRWQMDLASTRRSIFRSDVVRSALLYDEIVAQVIHLPTQIKAIEQLGGNPNRQKAALRYGKFSILIRNPQTVHVRYSDYMPEAVLYASVMKPQAIVDFWGEKAGELKQLIDSDKAAERYVLFDYTDYNARAVWCVEGDDETQVGEGKEEALEIVTPEKYELPFLNWVAVVGGTALDDAPEHRRLPLFYPVYRAEQWITSNIVQTLVTSEAIAEMGQPKVKKIGVNPEQIESNFGEPGGAWEAKTGNDVVDMQDRSLDPALRELADRLDSAMERATVSRILTTADSTPGESFSGFNLRVQTAIGSLTPYKELSERWFAEVYKQMLLWTHYSGETLTGYDRKAKDTYGKKYSIDSEDIDPNQLYMSVALTPDVPIDRQQKVNTAVMMSRDLKYPAERILEELGETDPEGAMRAWRKEGYMLAAHQGKLQLIAAQASGQIEQLAAQKAQEMIAEMMKGMAENGGGMGGEPMSPDMGGGMANMPTPGAPQGMPGVGGEGFAPNMGGQAPAGANPAGNIMEQQTGMSRAGDALQGGGI